MCWDTNKVQTWASVHLEGDDQGKFRALNINGMCLVRLHSTPLDELKTLFQTLSPAAQLSIIGAITDGDFTVDADADGSDSLRDSASSSNAAEDSDADSSQAGSSSGSGSTSESDD